MTDWAGAVAITCALAVAALALLVASTRRAGLRRWSWLALLAVVGLALMLVLLFAGPVAFWLMGATG